MLALHRSAPRLLLFAVLAGLAPELAAQAPASTADRDAAFAAKMTGAKLIGKYSVWTPQGEQMPSTQNFERATDKAAKVNQQSLNLTNRV